MSEQTKTNLPAVTKSLGQKALPANYSSTKHPKYGADLKLAIEREHMLTIVDRNPAILECTPESIQRTFLEAGRTGLSLNPYSKHLYVTAEWNSDKGCKEAQLGMMYGGMQELFYKSNLLKQLDVQVVYSNDKFRVTRTERGPGFMHEEARGTRGRKQKVYCFAEFHSGARFLEVMELEQIERIKSFIIERNTKYKWERGQKTTEVERKGYLSPSWRLFEEEQWRKVVTRRATKRWPEGQILAEVMQVIDSTTDPEPDYDDLVEDVEDIKADEGGYITINEDQALEIYTMVSDQFMESEGDEKAQSRAKAWVSNLADAMGFIDIRDLPSEKFDDAKTRMQSHIDKVLAA